MVSMQQPQPTRTHIRWTPDEQRRVIDDTAFHLKGMMHMIPQSDDTVGCQILFTTMRAAQHRQLPPDRRRKLVGRTELNDSFIAELARRLKDPPKECPEHYPWHPDKQPGLVRLQIPDAKEVKPRAHGETLPLPIAENHSTEVAAANSSVPPTPTPVVPVAEIPAKTEQPHKVLVSVEPARLSTFSDEEIFAETLRRMIGISKLVQGIEERLPTKEQLVMLGELHEMQKLVVDETGKLGEAQKQMAERMKSLEADVTKLERANDERPTDRLIPRVAILGCRKYEVEHIRQGCEAVGLKIDFRHYDQDESPRKIHADWAISLKWLSHSWDSQIKDCIGPGKYVFLNGGVGMAVNQLKTWFQSS